MGRQLGLFGDALQRKIDDHAALTELAARLPSYVRFGTSTGNTLQDGLTISLDVILAA